MTLADHYRMLGLREGAAFTEVKAAYRRLARRYHPDANFDSPQAKEKFIQVTEAYQAIARVIQPETLPDSSKTAAVSASASVQVKQHSSLTPQDQILKQKSFDQLQLLLKQQKLPRAIALVEGLAQRMPRDPEVKQWQAITYQRWARSLIGQKAFSKARIYLKKALRTDPHNRALWQAIKQDFEQLEQTAIESWAINPDGDR
ncbi:MAG: J domain-containing protein [Leptolyngbyaceae cyanobacterium SL_1_1]|nr:J domain-containing protein [Leptolyngbyaceae cyanobacterium RM1_1_2]NJO10548.1 J domain-containing protein [Leptolyngbyaceae cyanobacterium SL_1_1]